MVMWEQMDSLVRSGYTLQDLYTMPVYRRNFIVRLAIKRNEAENKASDASRVEKIRTLQWQPSQDSSKTPSLPNNQPGGCRLK